MPILDGLDITARTSGNAIIEDAIHDDPHEHRARRDHLRRRCKETGVFPAMVVQMIGVGEATGALDTMLAKIADFYEDEVDTAVAGMLTLLEPMMIAFLGVRRRRYRHRDVPADLRPDQQADGVSLVQGSRFMVQGSRFWSEP